MSTDAPPTGLVLVTNDDGIDAAGLHALAREAASRGLPLVVAAPARDMSGASGAIGPVTPRISISHRAIDGLPSATFAVDAPPALIVIAAMSGAFGPVPTAVLSGVNAGLNLGRAVLHSGTVGAALTAQNLGLPSVAISTTPDGDVDLAASVALDVLERLHEADDVVAANVNVPPGADARTERLETSLARFGAVTAALAGERLDFQLTIDPETLADPGSDGAAVNTGRVSVTWLRGLGAGGVGATLRLDRVEAGAAGTSTDTMST